MKVKPIFARSLYWMRHGYFGMNLSSRDSQLNGITKDHYAHKNFNRKRDSYKSMVIVAYVYEDSRLTCSVPPENTVNAVYIKELRGTSCALHTLTTRKYPPDCQRKPLQEQHLENSYSKTKIGLQNQIMNTMDMWRRKEN